MTPRSDPFRLRSINEIYSAQICCVKLKSISYTHYRVLPSVTLCGRRLKNRSKPGCDDLWDEAPEETFDCPWCQAVIDLIVEEFSPDDPLE